jgi:hypothetical protein
LRARSSPPRFSRGAGIAAGDGAKRLARLDVGHVVEQRQ